MKVGITPKEGGSFENYFETEVVEELQFAEELGFDSAWVTEHHTNAEEYWAAPLTRLAYMAGVTDEMELGTSIMVLPLHHPLEVAENVAVLDQMTGGRVTLAVALGYVEAEFDAFGIPREERAGRLVEGLQLIDEFLTSDGPVTYDGDLFSLDEWESNVEAVQDPRPPLWLGGMGDLTMQRSLKLADGWFPSASMTADEVAEREEKLKSIADSEGLAWDDIDHPLPVIVTVGETHEEAMELAKEYPYHKYYNSYSEEGDNWSHPLISPEVVSDFERFAEERLVVGTPEEVVEQLEAIRDRITVDHMMFRLDYGGMPHDGVMRQIELLGDEVVPELR